MKKTAAAFIAFLLLLLLPCAQAQLVPEHTYTGDLLQRIKLEESGEKYYVLDRAAAELRFYNADHSPWKTVNLPLDPGMNIKSVDYVTETGIDPDPGLEIAYTCDLLPGGTEVNETRIVREDGSTLLNRNSAYAISVWVHEEEGMPARLIIKEATAAFPDSFHVYTLSGLQWQHSYYGKDLKRVWLENSGEKYYLLNQADAYIQLYNADHTLWKQIDLPLVSGESIIRIEHVSESRFNPDALLEIGYYCEGGGGSDSRNRIASENGQLLLDTAYGKGQYLSVIPGLPARLIIRPGGLGADAEYRVYTVPGLLAEQVYNNPGYQLERIRLEESGEKYLLKGMYNSYLRLFNASHTAWKTMTLFTSPGYGNARLQHISETRIDPDTALEVCYIDYNNIQQHTEGWVRKEGGAVLLHLPGANMFRLSEIPGLPNKLLASVDTSTNNLHVYSLPSSTYLGLEPESSLPDGISVYPNPAAGSFVLQSSNEILKNVYIISMNGSLLQQVNVYTDKTTVDISGLQPGLYLVTGNRGNGLPFQKKVLIR